MSRSTLLNTLAACGLLVPILRFSALANPLANTQMQYSGAATIISETKITTLTIRNANDDDSNSEDAPNPPNPDDIQPDSTGPGLNLESLLSYELNHNFELQPTPHLSQDAASQASPASQIYNRETAMHTTIHHPTGAYSIIFPTLSPRQNWVGDNEDYPQNNPSVNAGGNLCENTNPFQPYAGHHVRRDSNGNLLLDPRSAAEFSSLLLGIAAPYLDHNDRLAKAHKRAAGANLPPADPNAPYGALVSNTDYALYTDKVAWDQAVYSWGQARRYTTCGGQIPMFVATTKKAGGDAKGVATGPPKPPNTNTGKATISKVPVLTTKAAGGVGKGVNANFRVGIIGGGGVVNKREDGVEGEDEVDAFDVEDELEEGTEAE